MENENLKKGEPYRFRTGEKQVKTARKGGIASAEARRKKRDLRMAIEALLEKDYTSKNGETVSGAEAIAIKQFEKAMKGDTRAFEVLRDTAGQKPIEKVMVADVEQSVIDEVEKAVLGDD
jgi:hypothetical protein